MSTIRLRSGYGRFTVRAAGVAIADGHVLVHAERKRQFWVLPGGRGEVGESTRETLVREMHEEMGIAVEAGRLLWVMENFFELRGKRRHETGFYYEMKVPEEWGPKARSEFQGREGQAPLHFRWVPLGDIGVRLQVQPRVLAERFHSLPQHTEHLIFQG